MYTTGVHETRGKENMIILCLSSVSIYSTHCNFSETLYLPIIIVTRNNQCSLVLFKVGEKAAVGHKWHDDIRSRPSIKTHTTKGQNIRMLEMVHLRTLFQHVSGC